MGRKFLKNFILQNSFIVRADQLVQSVYSVICKDGTATRIFAEAKIDRIFLE